MSDIDAGELHWEMDMETNYFRFDEVRPGTPEYELYLEARYQVFVAELHRVDEGEARSSGGHPIETDRYDATSRHFLAVHKATGSVAGFVRVILPSEVGLNVTPRYVIDRPLPYEDATDANIGEISRMAIAPHYRRRHEDQGKPYQGDPEAEMSGKAEGFRQHQPELVLGLYREVYRLCREVGIDYCVAAMDNRFSRVLIGLGFPFVAIGPINENVQPPRRVYLVSAAEMERSLTMRVADVMRFMQADGAVKVGEKGR